LLPTGDEERKNGFSHLTPQNLIPRDLSSLSFPILKAAGFSFRRYLSILSAAILPSFTAPTTVLPPLTISPAAKTPSMFVQLSFVIILLSFKSISGNIFSTL